MPIDSTHPSYDRYVEDWRNARDAVAGQRAIKAAGQRYLPSLSGQNDAEYKAYKERALFYSITSKTLSALVGMITEKKPVVEYPPQMAQYFDDNYGQQFIELVSMAASELMLVGRFGILVDRPKDGGKPYLTPYTTEDIINWRVAEDGSLTMLVLRETYWAPGEDEYEFKPKNRYRELSIVDNSLVIQIFEESAGKYERFGQPTTIINTGRSMKQIPFVCATSIGLSIEPVKPPMADIVDINISHYRTSADLEHGRHFTGLPTPYITGGESQKVLRIGSTSAWIIPDANAKVGFLEFTGLGLASLEKALTEKQAQLASMSARMIDNSSRGSEAAETVRLRYMSEVSGLKVTAKVTESLLKSAYRMIASMEDHDDTIIIKMNTDFLESAMSAAELKAWFEVYQAGGISKDLFVFALRKGQKLDSTITTADFPDLPEPIDSTGDNRSAP